MRVLLLCMLMSHVFGYSPSRRSYNYNPPSYGGDFGGQVVQQNQIDSQPPESISGQFWWQDNNNSPFGQQQQGDTVSPPLGICTAPVCPASSVCVHSQFCHNGLLVADGSAQMSQQVYFSSQRCGYESGMICCGVPSCNTPTPTTKRPFIRQVITDQQVDDSQINIVTVTPPPSMMMMGPMRSPGNCPGGLYCVERRDCDSNGFVINNPNMPNAVLPGVVPVMSCEVPKGNIQDGVCCQQVHPNAQGFD